MNEAAYGQPGSADIPDIPGWHYAQLFECPQTGLAVVRWHANDGRVYLAVRGTSSVRDVAESLRVFLGQNPARRQRAFEEYVQNQCAQALAQGKLLVGGHSLGGLIAASAAARWNLPGLVQNAPGWMTDPPAPDRLSRLLEIRTSRDTIGEWGTPFPRALLVALPQLPTREVSSLHSVRLQNTEIEKAWFASLAVDDPALELLAVPDSVVSPGLAGIPSRLRRAWRLLKSSQSPSGSKSLTALPPEAEPNPPYRALGPRV